MTPHDIPTHEDWLTWIIRAGAFIGFGWMAKLQRDVNALNEVKARCEAINTERDRQRAEILERVERLESKHDKTNDLLQRIAGKLGAE
jgi:hypothetical protein